MFNALAKSGLNCFLTRSGVPRYQMVFKQIVVLVMSTDSCGIACLYYKCAFMKILQTGGFVYTKSSGAKDGHL